MNKKNLFLFAIAIPLLTMGAGCTTNQATTDEPYIMPFNGAVEPSDPVSEDPKIPITYSTSGVSTSVSQKTAPFVYTANQLESMAKECGTKHEADYFDKLVTKFSGSSKTIYNFKYTGESQGFDTFVVTLLPNKAGYTSLDQFKKDFDLCYAAGDAYPTMLNDNWLLFMSSCGSGGSDGSNKPIGCQEVKDVVEPTIKLR
ncbi:MAG: hypothetical protein UV82_C0009G0048 [Candidatus Magasanikbacteria bacterium GW2011_GWD2_43_18]|uniref:Lipoprotein n=1 Tax=Candidatus Magasanikbacteria bacterium GW2011_GWE2_42_7 TaxID=1619052 RepID=A0A0G1DM93_9BACT|nr:MAG: hypothetical protein UV18_C0004G0132 [Candidatus Magasanikbacteria bacterium GW2011_GWC2_42_27]KKS71961.1 MAG: hypothetical protein UV42_C0016G0010 [Candidatus Magasanikbacteria bacterium GW2011_GWE2_42_7]KKT04309.1 MAG: hypothetical protein UV82_C0009G0048 [Candidatus Magasanikbacteria bacterium GW2011_GWD2_43_18]KKT24297.1 MAG: hypothetical protein UW10_C0030G0013 [Candidatus Magasanikbacteria bacterium GW2011_GWA2_43_9]HBB38347.1 hypothetical protein [Candidatus Magasanikbacteria bac